MDARDAREKLKAAIADLNQLTTKIENLESATARAVETLEQAQVEVETYAGLEKSITKWRVAQVKQGASTKKLPEALAAKVDAKKTAESEVEQSRATLEALQEELKELRKGVEPLRQAQQSAAVDVLIREHVDDLAREYSVVSARTRELAMLLHGIAHLEVQKNGKMVGIGYPQSAMDALKLANQFPPEVDVHGDMGTRWQRRLGALLKDPDATIARPKVIVPSDYVRSNPTIAPHFGFPLPAEYSIYHPVD